MTAPARAPGARGFTLLELLLAAALLALLVGAVSGAARGLLRGFEVERGEAGNARAASVALGRIARFGSTAQAILFPALNVTSTDSLVFTAGIDEDHDGRINEDGPGDASGDARPGKKDKDDDGDGLIDEDKIGRSYGTTGWGTFVPGVGATSIPNDDDEDSVEDEDPTNRVAYRFSGGTLTEEIDGAAETLATGLGGFQAQTLAGPQGVRKIVRVRIWYGAPADTATRLERIILPANIGSQFGVRTEG